jgi:hypothetical protein
MFLEKANDPLGSPKSKQIVRSKSLVGDSPGAFGAAAGTAKA